MLNMNNVSFPDIPLGKTEKYNQSPLERNINILVYLKKFDGDWKNTREISTYSGKTMHRGRLEEVLDQLVTRELISKRDAENPQAKFEYKIIDKGKEVLVKYLKILDDPDLKLVSGIKEDKKFEEA